MRRMALWGAGAMLVGACAGGGAATTTTTTAASSTTASTAATTTTAAPVSAVMPLPIPLTLRTFANEPDPEATFSLTLFVGSPLKAAIGAPEGFPEGCVGLTLFAPDYLSHFFDGYIPTVPGGCGTMEPLVPEDAIVARTMHSLIVELGDVPETPFIPAFQVSLRDAAAGWYSLPRDPVDPTTIPTIPDVGYLTHAGGGLFSLPAWVPVPVPDPEPGDCAPEPGVLCLLSGRFRVETGFTGTGTVPPTAGGTATGGDATLWFFDPDNVDLVLKMLDGCDINGRFWVFAGSLSGTGASLSIEDTRGTRTTIAVPEGQTTWIGDPVIDTDAFATCP